MTWKALALVDCKCVVSRRWLPADWRMMLHHRHHPDHPHPVHRGSGGGPGRRSGGPWKDRPWWGKGRRVANVRWDFDRWARYHGYFSCMKKMRMDGDDGCWWVVVCLMRKKTQRFWLRTLRVLKCTPLKFLRNIPLKGLDGWSRWYSIKVPWIPVFRGNQIIHFRRGNPLRCATCPRYRVLTLNLIADERSWCLGFSKKKPSLLGRPKKVQVKPYKSYAAENGWGVVGNDTPILWDVLKFWDMIILIHDDGTISCWKYAIFPTKGWLMTWWWKNPVKSVVMATKHR